MHLFYCSTPVILPEIILNEEESRHCSVVLRLKKGDEVGIVDGRGTLYKAVIVDPLKDASRVVVKETISGFSKRSYHLHLAVAPTKNTDRFEWFVEKAVEIGVDEITPMYCEHSERRKINTDRLERLMISAMKQSVKAYLPLLHKGISFNDFIAVSHSEHRFIAHCTAGAVHMPQNLINRGEDVLIMIGPEGDFSENEIKAATEKGYCPLSLGSSRLRTETAAICACLAVYLINEG